MKKIIFISAMAIAFVACNNTGTETTTSDSTNVTQDKTQVNSNSQPTLNPDTSKIDPMNKKDSIR